MIIMLPIFEKLMDTSRVPRDVAVIFYEDLVISCLVVLASDFLGFLDSYFYHAQNLATFLNIKIKYMNSDALSNYSSLILATFSETKNELRKEAEQSLIQNALKDPNAVEDIVAIIQTFNAPDNLREFASIFLNSLLKRFQYNTDRKYDLTSKQRHANLCLQCFLNQQLSKKIKNQIGICLCTIFLFDIENLRLQFAKQSELLLQSPIMEEVSAGIYIFNSVVQSIDIHNNAAIKNDLDLLWLNCFFSIGKDILIKFNPQEPLSMVQLEQFMGMLEVAKHWSQSIRDLCKKVMCYRGFGKENLFDIQSFMLQSEGLSSSLFSLILFTPQVGQQLKDTFVSTIGMKELDDIFNETKKLCLSSISWILEVLFMRDKLARVQNIYFLQISQLLPSLMISIIFYVTSKCEISNETLASQFVCEILKYICVCAKEKEFYGIFFQSKVNLLVDVIYPLMSSSSNEILSMIDDPDQFLSLAEDTVEKQESEIPKCQGAKLVRCLCDYIDGTTTFLTQIAISILKTSILQLNEIQIETLDSAGNQHDKLFFDNIKERFLYKNFTPQQRIEMSLMILSIISYKMASRIDLLQQFETMLVETSHFFSKSDLDPIIRSRLCLFLGYFSENLFLQDPKPLQNYIHFLVNQLEMNSKAWHQSIDIIGVMQQAIKSLARLIECDRLRPVIIDFLPQTIPLFCAELIKTSYEQLFELLTSIVRKYADIFVQLPNLLSQLVSSLTAKIIKEYQLIDKQKKDRYIFINKSWNILRLIPQIETYQPFAYRIIDEAILPLYALLEHRSLESNDDMLLLLTSLIEKQQFLTGNQRKVFLLLPKVLLLQKNQLGYLFELLNFYILYGKDFFSSKEIQQIVTHLSFLKNKYFSIGFQALNAKHEPCEASDRGEGALLIQLALQQLKANIDQQVLEEVIKAASQLVSTDISPNFLKARYRQSSLFQSVFGIFLSSIYVNFEPTYAILNSLNLYASIINIICQNVNCFTLVYDIKLFIAAFASLASINSSLVTLQIMQIFITLLAIQEKNEILDRKKMKDDEYDDDDVDSSSSDDQMDLHESEAQQGNQNEQIEEQKISIDQFHSFIKQIDEFSIFQDLMHHLKNQYQKLILISSNPEFIQQLKEQLQPDLMKSLQNYLHFKRIQTQEGILDARKIVSAKRRKAKFN